LIFTYSSLGYVLLHRKGHQKKSRKGSFFPSQAKNVEKNPFVAYLTLCKTDFVGYKHRTRPKGAGFLIVFNEPKEI